VIAAIAAFYSHYLFYVNKKNKKKKLNLLPTLIVEAELTNYLVVLNEPDT